MPPYTLAACAFLAANMATASYINIFGSQNCDDFTSTSDFPANGQCVNLSPYAKSWEFFLKGNSGCTVHVFENSNCQNELVPAQSTYVDLFCLSFAFLLSRRIVKEILTRSVTGSPNQCNDSPVCIIPLMLTWRLRRANHGIQVSVKSYYVECS